MTARDSLARMHAQIKNGDYQAANTFAWAAIAEVLVQMVEPAPTRMRPPPPPIEWERDR